MRTAPIACLLLSLVPRTANAELSPTQQKIHVLSARWAEYYATVYQVPVELVMAIIDEESGWDPYAISGKGAVGLMQLMPQTATRFGVLNRFQVNENIRGGVAYLARLTHQFHGDLRLVTAAYYVGESPIEIRGLDYSSAAVQQYVQRVAKRYRARRRRAVNTGDEEGGGE